MLCESFLQLLGLLDKSFNLVTILLYILHEYNRLQPAFLISCNSACPVLYLEIH